MKTFTFEFTEEVTSQVEVKAKTEAEARKKVEEGNFSNDEIMERDHFEITNSWEGHKSSDEKQPNEGLGVWNGYKYVRL